MPPISPLTFKHFVLAVHTPACLLPLSHCTTASPYLSPSSTPFSSFSFPTAVPFGAHPYRYQGLWERSGLVLSVTFPALPLSGWKLVWRKTASQLLPSLKRQTKRELRGNYWVGERMRCPWCPGICSHLSSLHEVIMRQGWKLQFYVYIYFTQYYYL